MTRRRSGINWERLTEANMVRWRRSFVPPVRLEELPRPPFNDLYIGTADFDAASSPFPRENLLCWLRNTVTYPDDKNVRAVVDTVMAGAWSERMAEDLEKIISLYRQSHQMLALLCEWLLNTSGQADGVAAE